MIRRGKLTLIVYLIYDVNSSLASLNDKKWYTQKNTWNVKIIE